MKARLVCAGALACATAIGATVADDARAAGMYFSDRGVRPMGRAGAWVAGADDLGAIWYNPAGLTDAKSSVLVDFAWLRMSTAYTRRLKILDADNTYQTVDTPTVNGSSPIIPIPTLAASYAFGDKKEWTVAGGLYAPYVSLVTYPDQVDGQPSPGRYALGSFDGSLLFIGGLFLAYAPPKIDWLRLGAGVQMLTGVFQSEVTFSTSPEDRLVGQPEQPDYDAKTRMRVGPIFAPSANAGITLIPDEHVRFGASGQLPMIVDAPAQIYVRLPTAAVFDGARVVGTHANVHFELPAIARVGVEVRPTDRIRVELAYVRELWTTHHAIDATPTDITIQDVVGLPSVIKVPAISYPRNFENSNSFRLGGELSPDVLGYRWDVRLGVAYETSAVPPQYLTLQTIDVDKVTASLGLGLHVGAHWRLDAVYAHVFTQDVFVDPDQARIPRVNPVRGNAPLEPINGGTYHVGADLMGVGLAYTF
jgi:long-chain fatty acid transport protein